jgi:hypothetical protein
MVDSAALDRGDRFPARDDGAGLGVEYVGGDDLGLEAGGLDAGLCQPVHCAVKHRADGGRGVRIEGFHLRLRVAY